MLHTSLDTAHDNPLLSPPITLTPDWLGLLERSAHAGCWTLDVASQQLSLTPGLTALLAWTPEPRHPLSWQAFVALFAPTSQAAMADAIEVCSKSGKPFELEAEIINPPGRRLWVRSVGQAVQDSTGAVVAVQGAVLDLSEKKCIEHEQELLRLLQTSIAQLNDMVLIAEAARDGAWPHIVFVNEAFLRQTGYSQAEVLGRTLEMLQGPQTQSTELKRISHALDHAQPLKTEIIYYKKNGSQFWMDLDIVPVDYQHRGLTHWVAVGRDITARKAADEQIEHLAFYDPLTQLPNRQLLTKRLDALLSSRQEPKEIGALMFIDLDNFKVLNDTLGHSRGDMMLQQVASRLQTCVRRSDTVARLGGDEFVVMLEDLSTDPERALQKTRVVGEKILASLSVPYDLNGNQYHGTCSIGVTPIGSLSQGMGDALKQADLAMYQAKAAGRNTMCFFDPEMQIAATANATLSTDLRQAFFEHQFVLYYQPQVGREGQMVGVEALLRWQRPGRLVMPDDFILQAEKSGLILLLGGWVLETACAQLLEWSGRPETANLSIAVNVSVRQFCHPEFVDQVMALIQRTGVQASRLKLELTESLLAVDIDVTIAKMGMLKDAGVTLSIDDFGTGYSALSYLKKLPLDQLKICRTFVKDVLTNPNDAAIARTIIGLAQSLGLELMAEGVETQAQRDFLMRHGCDSYQGHLFSKALPIGELDAFISAHFAAQTHGSS